jgi:hypothetical protein
MGGAFAHFGLPDWFRIELTVAKTLGALALLIPTIPNRIKEFAYCGFAITPISAVIATLLQWRWHLVSSPQKSCAVKRAR